MVLLRVLCALALFGSACGRGKRAPRQDTDTPENQALLTKLQPYVLCLDHAVRVFELEDVFRAGTIGAVQATPDPKECLESSPATKRLPPALPDLDAAGDAYAGSLASLHKLTSAIQSAPASAAQRQTELLAAFAEFGAKHGALFDLVFRLNRQVHLDQLALREQRNGRTLAIVTEHAVLDAEGLVQLVDVRWDHLDNFDATALTNQLATFERSLEEMIAYSLAEPAEAKGIMETFWVFREQGRELVVATRQFAIRVRDKVPFTEAEKIMIAATNERGVVGSPAAVVDAYNKFIDTYHPSKQP